MERFLQNSKRAPLPASVNIWSISLEIAASSAMTLDGVEAARLLVFRDAIGSEFIALI